MRRLLLLLLLLALTGASVWAQPMPDAREMSGRPRGDAAVAAGTVTVKVVHGELAALATPGTLVHLVAVSTDGGAQRLTRAVDDQGRAEFSGLATDGKTVYYALCMLGEDRLLSDPITLPPKVGVRLMLVGRKRDAGGAPAGPAIDDEQTEVPIPAGEVQVAARGLIKPGTPVRLRALGSDAPPVETTLSGGTAGGEAKFVGIPTGADQIYSVEIAVDGRSFIGRPILMSPRAGVGRLIFVHDKPLFAFQGGAQVDEGTLSFQLALIVANLTGVPFDTGAQGLLLELPRGFTGGRLSDEDLAGRAVIEPEHGVRIFGVVPPGERQTIVQFDLPIRDGRVGFDMPAPLGIFQSQLFIAQTGQMVVTPITGATGAPKMQRSDDGREYVGLAGITVSPGGAFQFDLAGLPVPAAWQRGAGLAVGAVVVGLLLVAMFFALRPRTTAARLGDSPARLRQELSARRDQLYVELVALERARAAGRIDAPVFEVQRRTIMTKLVLVHRELDALDEAGAQAAAP